MADANEHRLRASENEDLAEFLVSDPAASRETARHRWAVMAYHYAGHQYVHAYLAGHARGEFQHPKKHGDTERALVRTFGSAGQGAVDALAALRDLSEGARYLDPGETRDSWYRAQYQTEAAATAQAASELQTIKRLILPLL